MPPDRPDPRPPAPDQPLTHPLPGFPDFAQLVKEKTGLDLAAYNPRQLFRRLRGQLQRIGCRSLAEYGELLRRSPEQVEAFRDFLTINVSEFFRNPTFWQAVAQTVLPQLLPAGLPRRSPSLPVSSRSRPATATETNSSVNCRSLRLWSAGCSVGAEPYSLAILLAEAGIAPAMASIIATDLDDKALAQARTAVYPAALLREVSAQRLARFFVPVGPQRWQVRPEVRRRVQLRHHDLLQDPYPLGLDLIVCRNVTIYFNEAAKQQVHRRLAQSLRPGGFLFVGATEAILSPAQYGLTIVGPFFYRRVESSSPFPAHQPTEPPPAH